MCEAGFDAQCNTFVQSSRKLNASLPLIPLVSFLPPGEPSVCGTIDTIERETEIVGLVQSYRTEAGLDGLPLGEGFLLPCSFRLVQNFCIDRTIGRSGSAV